jgi:diguanylate cyclase (GGDEF)-like protein
MTTVEEKWITLPDRAALKEALEQAIAAGDGVALAILDIDRCGALWERFGAEAVRRVVETLVTTLKEAAPGHVYEIAGDAFALVMPGTSVEQAFLRMEELRRMIGAAGARFGLPEQHEVAVSLGVAHCPRDAREEEGLMRAAFAGLLIAKEQGGNQVALAPGEEMVMKSCYYSTTSARNLKALAERLSRKESALLREALDDLLRKYEQP